MVEDPPPQLPMTYGGTSGESSNMIGGIREEASWDFGYHPGPHHPPEDNSLETHSHLSDAEIDMMMEESEREMEEMEQALWEEEEEERQREEEERQRLDEEGEDEGENS